MIDNTTIVYTSRSAEPFATEGTEVTKNGARYCYGHGHGCFTTDGTDSTDIVANAPKPEP